jgi:hypothetical protein
MGKSYLERYIDNHIIREFSFKQNHRYFLDISDVDEYEKDMLIEKLLEHDPVVKDLILDRIQEIINNRLPFVELEDNYERGLRPIQDRQTGELQWV